MRTGNSRIVAHIGIALGALGGVGWMASSAVAQWTVINLHPTQLGLVNSSRANGVRDGQQVGYAILGSHNHAALWSGTAESWVDLNPVGVSTSFAFGVSGGATGRMGIRLRVGLPACQPLERDG